MLGHSLGLCPTAVVAISGFEPSGFITVIMALDLL
jgi:hypothetical protein